MELRPGAGLRVHLVGEPVPAAIAGHLGSEHVTHRRGVAGAAALHVAGIRAETCVRSQRGSAHVLILWQTLSLPASKPRATLGHRNPAAEENADRSEEHLPEHEPRAPERPSARLPRLRRGGEHQASPAGLQRGRARAKAARPSGLLRGLREAPHRGPVARAAQTAQRYFPLPSHWSKAESNDTTSPGRGGTKVAMARL